MKNLKKEHNKIIKKMAGSRKKHKDPDTPKKEPSGFCKPRQITEDLAMFLKIDKDDKISGPQLTKYLNKYIQNNKLQNEEDHRIIDLDKPGGEELRKLLKVPEEIKLSFMNLQHYTKDLFLD